MVKKEAPGRHIYEGIKESAPHNICPLCSLRTVSTLDHYLPKANFPLLVVMPNNLIPSCGDCNKIKLDTFPSDAECQTLHPYYDDVSDAQWLFAEVIQTSPVSIRFFANPPAAWNAVKRARVSWHFKKLELGPLYTSQAAVAIGNMRYKLNKSLRGDPALIRDHLMEEFESCREYNINSWHTAMYRALADSDFFCCGGFR